MNKTNLFFDMEFTGLQKNTTLISLGIVSECGKTFYAEFTDYDESQVDEWLKENVISKLKLTNNITVSNSSWENWVSDKGDYSDALEMALANKDMSNFECVGKTPMIKNRIEKWLSQFEEVQMVSDCLAYDWVLWNHIWGHAFNIPDNVFYIPLDICTMFFMKGIDPDIGREEFSEMKANPEKHNALWDAKVIKKCFHKLLS